MSVTSPGNVIAGSGLGTPLRNSGNPVAVAAVNEVQTITSSQTGGSATFTFNGQATPAQAFGVSAATLQTALRALSSIAGANVTCTGGALGTAPIVITFIGTLAAADQPLITIGAGFTGGAASVVETTKGVTAVAAAYAGIAAVGALCNDTTNKILYQNAGTVAAPTWSKVSGE